LKGVEGVKIEYYDESSALVVPKFHGGGKIVAGELVVYLEKLSEKMKILKTLSHIEGLISDALEYIRVRRDIESAKGFLSKLQLETYRELIEKLGEKEIHKVYHELLSLIKMGIIDTEAEVIASRLQKLKHLIREIIKNF